VAERVPPGRGGRLWLRARLEATRRGADLLDRKRQFMRRELTRLDAARAQAARAFESACVDADRWTMRALAVGGASDVAYAAAPVVGRSSAEVSWRNTMGVIHPDEPNCRFAELPSSEAAAANAAVAPAAAAARLALATAAAASAAEASFRVLTAELHATERRLRALEHHRIPALERALNALELRLEELERDERVVTRWAKNQREQALREPLEGSARP